MYASFGFVALMESRCKQRCMGFHFIIVFLIFVMSAIIEVLQATVVATRSAEWLDLAANFLGLIAGYFAFQIVGNWRIFNFLKY